MALDDMRRLLSVARDNINASVAVDADTKLYLALDCMLDVMNGLVDRQLTTEEDRA